MREGKAGEMGCREDGRVYWRRNGFVNTGFDMDWFRLTAIQRMGGMIIGHNVIPIILTTHVRIDSTDILREGYTMYTTSNRMNRIPS